MSLLKRRHIVGFLIFIGILLLFVAIENYLHKKEQGPKSIPYELSFYTHNGEKIAWNTDLLKSRHIAGLGWKNPDTLKLAIAPYTIIKNLPNQRTQYFTTNSLGFRGTREISNVSGRQKRIIVVGGSAAFGHGLTNDDETFQAIIEKQNSKYEVINAGVGGYFSGQELTYIVTELVDYNPDIIIAFDGWNDLFWSWYNEIWHGRLRKDDEMGFSYDCFGQIEAQLVDNYQSQVSISSSFMRFFITVVEKSIIISKIRAKMAEFKQKSRPQGLTDKKGDSHTRKVGYFKKIVSAYTKNLIKMHDFCQSQGIRFLVVFQPELGLKSKITSIERGYLKFWPRAFHVENYMDEFPQLYKLFVERSKEKLTKRGVDFIDINVHPVYKNNPNTLFRDFVHPNKNGNMIIAHIINEYLNTLL